MLKFLINLLRNLLFKKKKPNQTKHKEDNHESVKINNDTIIVKQNDMKITINSKYNIATIESNRLIDEQEAQLIINDIHKKYLKTNWENKNE